MKSPARGALRIAIVAGLLLFWWRLLHSSLLESATFDEIFHVMQGVLYWQNAELFSVVQNPPLVNALIGMPVSALLAPALPLGTPAWVNQDWLEISRAFMWGINPDGLQMLFLGRLAIMLLALLLAAVTARYSGRLFRSAWAGALALFLLTFDPNILAHGNLATTDLGTALFFTTAALAVWWFWQNGRDRWWAYALTAVAVGCVLAAKFSGIVFLIALVCITGYRLALERPSRAQAVRLLAQTTGWIALAVLVMLLAYRFQLPALLEDFRIQQEHQLGGHSAFLMGQISRDGWWTYFPVAFLIKTPLPVLLLFGATAVRFVHSRQWRRWELVWPWLLAAGIFAAGMTSRVNIGYRYLLPILPLLYVLAGQWAGSAVVQHRATRTALAIVMASTAVVSLWIHPHYLAYFNLIAGGPDNGWRWLVDSNIDWGQDVQGLVAIDDTPFQAAWLGTVPLTVYGIQNGHPQPVWPVGEENPDTDTFYPADPAPGRYALSVTQLQGVYLDNPARFAWFRERPPDRKIGYSLFVYDVAPSGEPVGLALSGLATAAIAPDDYARLASNDVRVRHLDTRTAFLWPGGGEAAAWTIVGSGHQPVHPWLRALYPQPVAQGQSGTGEDLRQYAIYTWTDSPLPALLDGRNGAAGWTPEPVLGAARWDEQRPLATPPIFGETLTFLGYQAGDDPLTPGGRLDLLTIWQVAQQPQASLKLFVHLIDAEGQVVAQHDGLDMQTTLLQPGDQFAQLHTIQLPDTLPSTAYALQLGVYDADTAVRLPIPVDDATADRLLLRRLR